MRKSFVFILNDGGKLYSHESQHRKGQETDQILWHTMPDKSFHNCSRLAIQLLQIFIMQICIIFKSFKFVFLLGPVYFKI
jgi:hypothetical protein